MRIMVYYLDKKVQKANGPRLIVKNNVLRTWPETQAKQMDHGSHSEKCGLSEVI